MSPFEHIAQGGEGPMKADGYWCKVGDVVIPADRSAYVGKVVQIDDTCVHHQCMRTGRVQTKSLAGFYVRYMFPTVRTAGGRDEA